MTAEVGRSDDTGTAAQFGSDFAVVDAVLDVVGRVVLGRGHEAGDAAVHGSCRSVLGIASAVSNHGEVDSAVLDETDTGSGVEDEAGDASQGETLVVDAVTGRSYLSADLDVLDGGGDCRSNKHAGIGLGLCGNIQVSYDVQVLDGCSVQYAEEAEGADSRDLDGRIEAGDGMVAAIENALEGGSGVCSCIVAVADRLGIADRSPLLVLGQVDVCEQLDLLGGVLPAADAVVGIHRLDELHELFHVRNASDAGGRIKGSGITELGDRNHIGLTAAREYDLTAPGGHIRLFVDISALHGETDNRVAAAEDRIRLDPGRSHDYPVGVGREIQDLVRRVLAGDVGQSLRI